MAVDIASLLDLSPNEKIEIIDKLWDSLEEESGPCTIPDWHREELERREREEGDDVTGRPWREVINEIRQGLQ